MKVVNPWQHSALIRKVIANAGKPDRSGHYTVDFRLTVREHKLLEQIVEVFESIERGGFIHREE